MDVNGTGVYKPTYEWAGHLVGICMTMVPD